MQAQAQNHDELAVDNSAAFAVEYSSLYTIPDIIGLYKQSNRPGPVIIEKRVRTHPNAALPGHNSVYPAQFLIDLTGTSALVAIVRFTNSQTHMTDDRAFLYTNFVGTIEQVLFDASDKAIAGDPIFITRAGGSLTVDGEVVKADDPEFHPFEKNARYLLFLKRAPGTSFFRAVAPGSFELGKDRAVGGEGVKRLDAHPLEELSEGSRTERAFLDEVSNAISASIETRRNNK